jgi:hypothetical protein
MTSRRDDNTESDRAEHLPADVRPDGLHELEPHQQTIERVANLYFEGCRRVAGAITALKSRLRDDD